MALIVCPNCGKKISDTASVCIHCGSPASPAPKRGQTLYTGLPVSKRTELETEFFYNIEPDCTVAGTKFANVAFCEKQLKISLSVVYVLFFCAAICGIFNAEIYTGLLFLCALLIFMCFNLMVIICIIIIKAIKIKRLKAMLIAIKRYQVWLAAERNILYSPHFDKKLYASLYSSIKI